MVHPTTTSPSSNAISPSSNAIRPSAALSRHQQVGTWTLVRLLAQGAMAEVFAAAAGDVDDLDSAPYAVKVLKPSWHSRPQGVGTIRREATVGAAISSPHVVPVLDAGVEQSPYFVTMPRLPGETLAQRLTTGGGLPVAEAIWIARQIAQGLSALHAAGWTHGDVSPSNIMIAPDGHVTLLDLGYAFHTEERTSVAERPVVGTLHYLAPEMITSALAADSQSDLYSLGTILYQMLTGRLPYEGRGPTEIVRMQRAGVPDRLRCLVPTLPREIVTLVRQLLCCDPLRRPETAELVVQRLIAPELAMFAETLAE